MHGWVDAVESGEAVNAPMLSPEDLTDGSDSVRLSLANSARGDCVTAGHLDAAQPIAEAPRTVSEYLSASIAANTRRAYQGDLKDFIGWGGAIPCSPEVLAQYVADRAALHSPHTIGRRVVGIAKAHVAQGLADPSKSDLVKAVLRGVRRSHGRPQRQAAPLLKQDLLALLSLMTGTKGLRDRALLLLGFAAALRRSEVVALDVTDLEFVREGLVVYLRRSKSDQAGEGRQVAVPIGRTVACPVEAIRHWLEFAAITDGPIFRPVNRAGNIGEARLTPQSVSLIVKHYAAAAGLPAAGYSGHSLRAGLATSAAQAGASTRKICEQTGHKSEAMLARYIRAGNRFQDNAAGSVL